MKYFIAAALVALASCGGDDGGDDETLPGAETCTIPRVEWYVMSSFVSAGCPEDLEILRDGGVLGPGRSCGTYDVEVVVGYPRAELVLGNAGGIHGDFYWSEGECTIDLDIRFR